MEVGPGSVLKDNVEIECELGRGAMGVVWLARNRALDSEVCVKVLRAEGDEPELRERFLREAQAVARIDHPHVVRIFDYGVTAEGAPFFIMERLRGEDLYARIGAEGGLPLEEAITVIEQAASALGRAHELGVVHRDIKPANVFLLAGAGRTFVKLLDFGIAKVATADDLGLTQTASLLGTPYYMSPEQFIDPRGVDHRTDLWSLSVVAYAAVLGQLPFLGATVGALSLAVHKGDFPLPSAIDPSLPRTLDAWFSRALDPEPDRRFASADELARSFAMAARGEGAEAASPTAADPPRHTPKEVVASDGDDVRAQEPTTLGRVDEPAVSAKVERVPALASSMEPVTSTRSGSPDIPSRRSPLVVGLAATAAIGLGAAIWWQSRDDAVAPPVEAASTDREVRLAIDPPNAAVRVNGVARPVHEGYVSLRGEPGDSFLVELTEGPRKIERTVFITRDGHASLDRIALPAPEPDPASRGDEPSVPAPTAAVTTTPAVPLPRRSPPAAPPPSPPAAEPPVEKAAPSRESWD